MIYFCHNNQQIGMCRINGHKYCYILIYEKEKLWQVEFKVDIISMNINIDITDVAMTLIVHNRALSCNV